MWTWRGMQGVAAASAILASGILLAGCTQEPGVAVVRATQTAIEAADETPEAIGTQFPQRTPEELAGRIIGGQPAMPAGYAIETTELIRSETLMPNLDRGIRYTLKGPDRTNVVTYYLFDSPEDARSNMGNVLAEAVRAESLSLGYPARVIQELSPDGQVGSTRVLVLMGQAVVESISTLGVSSPGGNQAHAIETAQAAITYFQAVAQ